MKFNLKDFDTLVKNKSNKDPSFQANELLIDKNETFLASKQDNYCGRRPCGAFRLPRQNIPAPTNNDNAVIIAHHVIENNIGYIEDQLGEQRDINEIRRELQAHPSNIHELNDADFDQIHQLIDFDELFQGISLEDSMWKEELRKLKKKLSEAIRNQMNKMQNGVTTWAKFAASLSRTMGSDAPMIAGLLCLTNTALNLTGNLYDQIRGYDGESGEVAAHFVKNNYTDATVDELIEVSAEYSNCS